MQKNFMGWLMLDWKTGKMRIVTRNPQSKVKYTEIPIKLQFEIEIPEKPQMLAEGKITLSEAKATAIKASIVEENL